jgi:hypothetical protein
MLNLLGTGLAGHPLVGKRSAAPGVDQPDETIDGFPEFTQDMGLIKDPTITPRLRAVAKKIIASHNNGRRTRIIGFEVHGHADATVRIADRVEAQRTEIEVSQERAENAKELLLKLIEEEGGRPIIQGIRANAKAQGFGSQHRKFIPAKSDSEMKKNRRVEIFLISFTPPEPRPTPPPQPKPPVPAEQGSNWRIQILDGGSATSIGIPGTDLSSLSFILFVEITDRDRKQKAKFRVLATGTSLPSGSVLPTAIQTSQVTKGAPSDFQTTKGVNLASFVGSVDVAQDPGASASVLSAGGNFNFSFRELDGLGAFSRPSVVPASAGSTIFSLPQFGLGGVTTGTLAMQGAPTATP